MLESQGFIMDLEEAIHKLIDVAIAEDMGSGDITTEVLVPATATTSGNMILKQAGVLAGLHYLKTIFQKFNPEIEVKLYVEEGSYQKAGTIIAKVSGPAQGILSAERLALNFIQHASGVATLTEAYVRKLAGIDCAIMDTRKTLPGLRALEKYAITVGGGVNHRFCLDEHYVIRTTHLAFINGNEPVKEAVAKAKAAHPELPIHVEISDLEQLEEALDTEAEAIMLTRMLPNVIAKSIKSIRNKGKKIYIESLGAITLDTVRAYAETGVDGIAIGSLSLSAEGLDIGMRLSS